MSYTIRFLGTNAAVHAFKRGLGDADINLRPSGNPQGFPSEHTAAAAFGASYLVHDCVQRNKVVQAAAVFGAAFVGASRIEAGKHFLFQVMIGALLGWLGERAIMLFRAMVAAWRRLAVLRRLFSRALRMQSNRLIIARR
ncbi:MAG: phosphatase PAP2 family protein [Pseudomonadota bacterium]